jgi:hypothetical protein
VELAQPEDQARSHDGLARAHLALGHQDLARAHWQQALDLLGSLSVEFTEDVETSASEVRAQLANLERRQPAAVVPFPANGLRQTRCG